MDSNGLEDENISISDKLQHVLLIVANEIFPVLNGYVLWSNFSSWLAFVGGVIGCWLLDAILLINSIGIDVLAEMSVKDTSDLWKREYLKKGVLMQLGVYIFLKIVFM